MPHWTGQETADITYADVDGALTALLIEKGYLSAGQWSGARPHYYIEVKTTVNAALETPFFLSSHQYTRVSLARSPTRKRVCARAERLWLTW